MNRFIQESVQICREMKNWQQNVWDMYISEIRNNPNFKMKRKCNVCTLTRSQRLEQIPASVCEDQKATRRLDRHHTHVHALLDFIYNSECLRVVELFLEGSSEFPRTSFHADYGEPSPADSWPQIMARVQDNTQLRKIIILDALQKIWSRECQAQQESEQDAC